MYLRHEIFKGRSKISAPLGLCVVWWVITAWTKIFYLLKQAIREYLSRQEIIFY